MANVTVVGAQWGDEGKGKIVDWLSNRADVVVRFQGGHNAGHTLVVGNQVYKLSLLPSGVVQGKLSVIGNGVVVDPWALLAEIERVAGAGRHDHPGRAGAGRQRRADPAAAPRPRQRARGRGRPTRSAPPAAASARPTRTRSAAARSASPTSPTARRWRPRSTGCWPTTRPAPRASACRRPTPRRCWPLLEAVAPKILPYAQPAWRLLDEAVKGGQRVLFEGAQGALLDVDHGTYPYVTSSNTVAGQAAAGSGLGPQGRGYVLGIVKAYTTRVGEGPFPTELDRRGRPAPGRASARSSARSPAAPRRCGWFDAVLVRQSVAINGIDGIALTKLDVLDGLRDAEDLHRLHA